MLTPAPLTTADSWLVRDMARRGDWRRTLSGWEMQALVAARATARATTLDRANWTWAYFPFRAWRPKSRAGWRSGRTSTRPCSAPIPSTPRASTGPDRGPGSAARSAASRRAA